MRKIFALALVATPALGADMTEREVGLNIAAATISGPVCDTTRADRAMMLVMLGRTTAFNRLDMVVVNEIVREQMEKMLPKIASDPRSAKVLAATTDICARMDALLKATRQGLQ